MELHHLCNDWRANASSPKAIELIDKNDSGLEVTRNEEPPMDRFSSGISTAMKKLNLKDDIQLRMVQGTIMDVMSNWLHQWLP